MEVERATCVAPATCVALPGGVNRQIVLKLSARRSYDLRGIEGRRLKPSARVYKSSKFMGHEWSIFKNSNDADIRI